VSPYASLSLLDVIPYATQYQGIKKSSIKWVFQQVRLDEIAQSIDIGPVEDVSNELKQVDDYIVALANIFDRLIHLDVRVREIHIWERKGTLAVSRMAMPANIALKNLAKRTGVRTGMFPCTKPIPPGPTRQVVADGEYKAWMMDLITMSSHSRDATRV
jgi:hypothetical protein